MSHSPAYKPILLAFLAAACSVWAQEKHHVSYQVPAENTKYVQQHVIDVGDVKGHQVRVLELKRTYPKDTLAFEGIPVTEEWDRGYSDYTEGSGRNWGYITFHLENGDQIFGRWDANAQTVIAADGSKKSSGISTVTLTGGTGKVRNLRGLLRGSYQFDPTRGINSVQNEGDYWMEQ